MTWRKVGDAAADGPVEELQEMLPSPPKRMAGRWTLLGLAVALLATVGLALAQTGLYSPKRRSALARISAVHQQIGAIVKAAVEMSAVGNDQVGAAVELVIDNYENVGTPPNAMTVNSSMQVGDEAKWPKVLLTFAAQSGKGADLEKKTKEIIDAILESVVPEDERDQINETITVSQTGDSVLVQVVAPSDHQMEQEDADMKAAFKKHKPQFHASLGFGRSFEEMHAVHDKSAALALRGIAAKLDAVFASTIFEMLSPFLPPQQVGALKALRMAKVKNEIYYSSEEELLGVLPPAPPLKEEVDRLCSMIPGPVASSLQNLDELMAGVSKLVLEGLPYGWEVVTAFKHYNPGHILGEHCAVVS